MSDFIVQQNDSCGTFEKEVNRLRELGYEIISCSHSQRDGSTYAYTAFMQKPAEPPINKSEVIGCISLGDVYNTPNKFNFKG